MVKPNDKMAQIWDKEIVKFGVRNVKHAISADIKW